MSCPCSNGSAPKRFPPWRRCPPSPTPTAAEVWAVAPERARPLLLIGASGFGRETAAAVRAVNDASGAGRRWELIGFLDDDPTLTGSDVGRLPVLGPLVSIGQWPTTAVVVCAA